MRDGIRTYKKRRIRFEGIKLINDWKVKVYTISADEVFSSVDYLEYVKKNLSEKLETARLHHKVAFLIVHEASDGVWTLLNWWTEVEMLQTETYFTPAADQFEMKKMDHYGSKACVWEMAVIQYESEQWINYILKHGNDADFEAYCNSKLDAWV